MSPGDWINKANPIFYVSERMCPLLIEHGTGGLQVPVQQSHMLYHTIVEKVGKERAEGGFSEPFCRVLPSAETE